MALVRNPSDHRVPLTVGYLDPGEERNIDTSPPWEQSLIAGGDLVVVDGSSSPPATTGHYAGSLKASVDYDLDDFPQGVVPLDLRGIADGQTLGFNAASKKLLPLSTVSSDWVGLAANPDQLIVGAITRDENGAATGASVAWPDGDAGTYTATTVSVDFPGAVDAYTITKVHGATTTTFTQPAVTRDATTGAVTSRPAIVRS